MSCDLCTGVVCAPSRLLTVDDQELALCLDLALEAAVGRVILEHVHHVVQVDERVVDSNDLATDARRQNTPGCKAFTTCLKTQKYYIPINMKVTMSERQYS